MVDCCWLMYIWNFGMWVLVMVMMRFLISSSERTFQFKIFGLVIEGKRWVEVESWRDQVLFLGKNCVVGLGGELSLLGGIACRLWIISCARGVKKMAMEVVVMEFSRVRICVCLICIMANCPEYSRLSWPPSDWVIVTNLTMSIVLCNIEAFYLFNLVIHGLNCSLV
jgi:hypothetical protein